jgi:hypothetical protein
MWTKGRILVGLMLVLNVALVFGLRRPLIYYILVPFNGTTGADSRDRLYLDIDRAFRSSLPYLEHPYHQIKIKTINISNMNLSLPLEKGAPFLLPEALSKVPMGKLEWPIVWISNGFQPYRFFGAGLPKLQEFLDRSKTKDPSKLKGPSYYISHLPLTDDTVRLECLAQEPEHSNEKQDAPTSDACQDDLQLFISDVFDEKINSRVVTIEHAQLDFWGLVPKVCNITNLENHPICDSQACSQCYYRCELYNREQ